MLIGKHFPWMSELFKLLSQSWEHCLMRIRHRMIWKRFSRISAIKVSLQNTGCKTLLLTMKYVSTEHENEFGFHLHACNKMIPYFLPAGHWNYARDSRVHLRMMEKPLAWQIHEWWTCGPPQGWALQQNLEWHGNRESDQSINVNKAEISGEKKKIGFQKDLPGTFRKLLTTQVVLMTSAKDKQAKRKTNEDE